MTSSSSSSSSSKGTTQICQTFNKQQEAFNFFDSLTSEQKALCKTYSFEVQLSKDSAYRRYMVADIDTFFDFYTEKGEFRDIESSSQKAPMSSRHSYEVIRDSVPCRAYFDLEFPVATNSEVQGDDLTAAWIQLVLFKIYHKWGLSLGRDDVIVLDSTSKDKFSKHVIIIIPNEEGSGEILFADNSAVGALVAEVLADITQYSNGVIRPLKEYEFLWIRNKNGEYAFFVDLSVYTRNRLFRLLWSSKAGKSQQLMQTPHDRKLYPGLQRACRGVPEDKASRTRGKREALERSFVVPFDVQKAIFSGCSCLRLATRLHSHTFSDNAATNDRDPTITVNPNVIHNLSKTSGAGWNAANVIEESHQMPSIFPDIDKVVLCFLSSLGSGSIGTIKNWCFYATSRKPTSFRIRYMVIGTKYCLNVSREHTSNNIYLEADLTRKVVYQRCFSRKSCPGFSSRPVPIPAESVPTEAALLLIQFDKALQIALQQGIIK